MDSLSPAKRSWNMGRIKAKGTKPEELMAAALKKAGINFERHIDDLPGKPDFFIKSKNLIIFVHGCFWHRHKNCKYTYNPKTRTEFWQAKFESNVKRDKAQIRRLRYLGYRVWVFWECQVKDKKNTAKRLLKI